MPEEFNSVEANIPAVKEHVEANPDSTTSILEAEQARGEDARKSLVEWLEARLQPAEPEAPTSVEVSLSPEEPEVNPANTRSFFGKQYSVTPEGGHRAVV